MIKFINQGGTAEYFRPYFMNFYFEVKKMKKFYITTAIDYTSGKPHIGNNYEKVYADVVARFKRLEGYDVLFQTGTDEHGQKVKENAQIAGKDPVDFVKEISNEVRKASDLLNVSYDKFVRKI